VGTEGLYNDECKVGKGGMRVIGMNKRDICFAQCCTYLLSWLIRDASKERHHSMKESLAFIHRTLNDEDEATSQPEPDPVWKKPVPIADEGGDEQAPIEALKSALRVLGKAEDKVDQADQSWALDDIGLLIFSAAEHVRHALQLLRAAESREEGRLPRSQEEGEEERREDL